MLGAAAASDVPGTKLAGRRPAARTRCVALSPTNRCWAAASTEGLLVYRCEHKGVGSRGGMRCREVWEARGLLVYRCGRMEVLWIGLYILSMCSVTGLLFI